MCSVGILSNCDCSQTSLDQADLQDYAPQLGSCYLTASIYGQAETT